MLGLLEQIAPLVVGGLKIGAIYALAALGLVVIHKATKTVNFSHGAFIMFGAYGAYFAIEPLGLGQLGAYLAVPLAIGVVAMAVESVVLRRLREADVFRVVVATIFLSVAFIEGTRHAYETELLHVPSLLDELGWDLGTVTITGETLWVISGALSCAVVLIVAFDRAGVARGLRAMASNMRGAQLSGYSVNGMFALAWFLGGIMAGLAGVFAAPPLGVSPDLAIATIVPAFVAAIIGGFDSLRGALLGGLLLGIVETLAATMFSSALKSATTFVVLLIFLLVRPQGLFPEAGYRNA